MIALIGTPGLATCENQSLDTGSTDPEVFPAPLVPAIGTVLLLSVGDGGCIE